MQQPQSQIKQVCPINAYETQSHPDSSMARKRRSNRKQRFFVFQEQEQEMGRQTASGSCPYCESKVEAVDLESQCSFYCIPMCFNVKRKFFCTKCGKRLVLLFQ